MEDQLFKVNLRAHSSDRVSWARLGHGEEPQIRPAEKSRPNQKRTPEANRLRALELETGEVDSWKIKLRRICNTSGTVALSAHPDSQQKTPRIRTKDIISYPARGDSAASLVAREFGTDVRTFHTSDDSIPVDRCVGRWLECSSARQNNQGYLAGQTNVMAHKQKGVVCRFPCIEEVQGDSEAQNRIDTVRQPDGCCLYKKRGRHQIQNPSQNDGTATVVCKELPDPDISKVHPGGLQQYCRSPVSAEGGARLAPVRDCHSSNFSQMGPTNNRSVCNQEVESRSCLC
ncbi:unnamed protein product [Acanthoscelides obtectus]|uniref:Uncharacterized protein n=1 Tax=Acanthoscelides obtectus TaxID=200917 RepID=A0A9P0Q1V5_ACAOB|nr:unnamed protein product [Acanthoscelides obtectus]CAK1664528.1 hypothetical protein AOBTE_LOCUS24315 [Acanthoscelides obtectus]